MEPLFCACTHDDGWFAVNFTVYAVPPVRVGIDAASDVEFAGAEAAGEGAGEGTGASACAAMPEPPDGGIKYSEPLAGPTLATTR